MDLSRDIPRASDPALVRKRARHHEFASTLVLPEMMGRLSWGREMIEREQLTHFRGLLRHVRQNSPWYRDRLGAIDPDLATLDDLQRIPPMTRQDLMDNWDRIVTIPGATLAGVRAAVAEAADQGYLWDDTVAIASGGFAGEPGLFLFDWNAIAFYWGSLCRSIIPTLLRRVAQPAMIRAAAIGAGSPAHMSYVINRIFASSSQPKLILPATLDPEDMIAPLNRCQPQLLSCYPSVVPGLAAAARRGDLQISPEVILFGSESLSDALRSLARATWPKADLFDCWGTSEGGMAFPCPYGKHFHLGEDIALFEPVDESGEPADAGKPAAGLYLTTLYNRALPIIRYHIDDRIELSDQPCLCGSAYRSVRRLGGRSSECFAYDAASLDPPTVDAMVAGTDGVTEYQIRQSPTGVDIRLRAGDQVAVGKIEERARAVLGAAGLVDPEVRVSRVTTIARTPAGKQRRIVPLPARRPA